MIAQLVRDAMVPAPTMLVAGETAQAGGLCLENPEIRAVFVCEDDGTLIGVITRKTLVREVVATGLDPTTVILREIAEPPFFTLEASLLLDDAFHTLEERDLERVPVVEEGTPRRRALARGRPASPGRGRAARARSRSGHCRSLGRADQQQVYAPGGAAPSSGSGSSAAANAMPSRMSRSLTSISSRPR